MKLVGAAALSALALAGCTALPHSVPARLNLDGEPVETRVDSELARYYATEYRHGRHGDSERDDRISAVLHGLPDGIPDRAALSALAKRTSPDFAALVLADRLLADPVNRRFAADYTHACRRIEQGPAAQLGTASPAARYLVVFVPGWGYRSAPDNGADFARPRQALAALGVETVLVETDENGAVEDNAQVVAAALAARAAEGSDLIVVSASKSAAEVGLALTRLDSVEARRVRGWLNVVGILQGSPLADWALSWPRRGLTALTLATSGFDGEGLESMTTVRSRERFQRFSIPEHVTVVNYIGIPLSGTISARARSNYLRLRQYGPNDGFSLLIDQIYPGGITLAALGKDHYMLGTDMGVRTAALAETLIEWLDSDSQEQRGVSRTIPRRVQAGAETS